MIFDNVESDVENVGENTGPEDHYINNFWPSGNQGSILVTTRYKNSLGQFLGDVEEMQKLKNQDAVDLLFELSRRTRSTDSEEDAEKICSRVDYLPLAIAHVAWKIDEDTLSLKEYLEIYTNMDLIQYKPLVGPLTLYPYGLLSVWAMNFERLEKGTQFLLEILAFLDPAKVQEKLLLEGAASSGDPRLRFISSKKRFLQERTKLTHSILISINADLEQIWMHRLVQESCHIRMDAPRRQSAFEAAFNLLRSVWPVPERHYRHRPELWVAQQEYLPHITSLAHRFQESLDEYDGDLEFEREIEASQSFAELLYNGAW